MKYLKKFNESEGWVDYITRLSIEDFRRIPDDKKFISLSKLEMKLILESFPDAMIHFNFRCDKIGNVMSLISNFDENDGFAIYKDDDEWFYIIYSKGLMDSIRSKMVTKANKIINVIGNSKLFKCDQIDGVIRLIKEYKEWINK